MLPCTPRRPSVSNSSLSAMMWRLAKLKAILLAEGMRALSSYGSWHSDQGTLMRRGLAGTCLVYKIAGALASRGASLDEVYNIAEWVASRIATIGVGSEHCHVRPFTSLLLLK